MGYLDSDGLKRFAQNVKNKAMWNWQWTKTAPCVHFWPGEETELEPVVDFLFKEIPPAEGEKGPDNPSTIQGIDTIGLEVTNNMFRLHVANGTKTQDGVTITIDDDGTITLDGTATETNAFVEYVHNTTAGKTVFPKGTKLYTKVEIISGTCTYTTGYGFKAQWSAPKTDGRSWYPGWSLKTKDTLWETDCDFHVLSNAVAYYKGTVYSNLKFKVHFQIDHPIERIESQVIQNNIFNLGATYYGGKVNLKTGEMTVTYEMIQPERNFIATRGGASNPDGNVWQFYVADLRESGRRLCNTFDYKIENGYIEENYFCNYYNWDPTGKSVSYHCSIQFAYINVEGTSEENARQNLLAVYDAAVAAGKPIMIGYPVETPYTIQLTPQQILSLPRLDHYVPRMNIVYTDQQSVKVGYRRIDNADAQSDEEISGTKTFVSSPLVPNPNDLDSQQAAPISFTKDMIRAEIEALTSGRNTIVRDQWGNPHIMVVMPKFMLSAIDPSWPNEPHPAFIVNGVQKSEVLIGKYLASKSSASRVQTLPIKTVWTSVTLDNAISSCFALGNGFCLNTNAIWSARALWLHKTLGENHTYLGNRYYGQDSTYPEYTGIMQDPSYLPGDTGNTGKTLTGSGGIKWNDDETEYGIADLVGNVYERCAGLRCVSGELQLIVNNNAASPTCDLSSVSSEWKAILQDGSLVTPGTSNSLKYDGNATDTTDRWVGSGAFKVNTTMTYQNVNGYYGMLFNDFSTANGIVVPNILKQLTMFPIGSNHQGRAYVCNKIGEETYLCRSGAYNNSGYSSGPFTLDLTWLKTYTSPRIGFRTAYIP